jgi:hypothetical protein
MIEAFRLLAPKLPDAKLIVAGGDHPQAAGYVESVKQQNAGNASIEFRGYVPEHELPDLFQSSSVAVMPYTSSTGCSGVAHLACAFSVPIVSADLADFRQMAQSEELAIEFYPSGDAQGLADCLHVLLTNPEKQYGMAMQNFSAALRMTMPNVVQKYLRHFELQQRVETLKYISRVRRLPRWIPSKSLLLRLLTRNSLTWARRSVVLHTPWQEISQSSLVQGDGYGSGSLGRPSIPSNDHNVVVRDGRTWSGGWNAAAGDAARNGNSQHHNGYDAKKTPAIDLSHEHHADQAESEQPVGDIDSPNFAVARGARSRSIQGQNGAGRIRPRNDRTGSE